MFYFYFEPIVGPEFESGSDRWTGECGPELTILTAHMALLFKLGTCDIFLERVLFVGNVPVSPHPIKDVPEQIYTYILSF